MILLNTDIISLFHEGESLLAALPVEDASHAPSTRPE